MNSQSAFTEPTKDGQFLCHVNTVLAWKLNPTSCHTLRQGESRLSVMQDHCLRSYPIEGLKMMKPIGSSYHTTKPREQKVHFTTRCERVKQGSRQYYSTVLK